MKKHYFLFCIFILPYLLSGISLSDTAFIQETLCAYDSIIVNNTVYDIGQPNGTEVIANGSVDGSDSIIVVDLQFYPVSLGQYRDTFCASQTVLLFGKLFSPAEPSATLVFPAMAFSGCDSLLEVEIDFSSAHASLISDAICPNDTVWIHQTAYHSSFYIGEELLENASSDGCDSLVRVELQPLDYGIERINDTLYADETFSYNGQAYDVENNNIQIPLGQPAVNGCDSVLEIALTFIQRPQQFLYIPTAFQINSDMPENQVLTFGQHPDVDFITKLYVFDRWGNLLLERQNKDDMQWDGFINGALAKPDVYLIALEFLLKNGEKRVESGDVLLLR